MSDIQEVYMRFSVDLLLYNLYDYASTLLT